MIIASLFDKSIAKIVAVQDSVAILDRMVKKSTGLEQWQVEDAARLKRLFEAREPKISQMKFGEDYGIGSQGMVWQYLSAARPLNIDAATKFALGLGVSIDDFSVEIAGQIESAYGLTHAGRQIDQSLPQAFTKLTHTQQNAVRAIIESYGVMIEPVRHKEMTHVDIDHRGKKQSSQSS